MSERLWYLSDDVAVADNIRVVSGGVWSHVGALIERLTAWNVDRARLDWRYLIGGKRWVIVMIRER